MASAARISSLGMGARISSTESREVVTALSFESMMDMTSEG